MTATDLDDFPATNEELTEWVYPLEAVFAIDTTPIPSSAGPLRVAARAMAAR